MSVLIPPQAIVGHSGSLDTPLLAIFTKEELKAEIPAFVRRNWEIFIMASSARIFFAGVGTTFAILAVGFGGGILMANSTSTGTPAQKHTSSEPPAPARIVYPSSAEPASPVAAPVPTEPTPPSPQVSTQATSTSEAQPQGQVEERPKTRRELRADRRRRYAERRARRHQIPHESPDQREPGIMAFDGDAPPRAGFFGN